MKSAYRQLFQQNPENHPLTNIIVGAKNLPGCSWSLQGVGHRRTLHFLWLSSKSTLVTPVMHSATGVPWVRANQSALTGYIPHTFSPGQKTKGSHGNENKEPPPFLTGIPLNSSCGKLFRERNLTDLPM